jgi:hypothetical protein
MLFLEALQALKDGKQVVRKCWNERDGYLVLLPEVPMVWKILTHEKLNAGGYPFVIEDYDASDWMLLSDRCSEEAVKCAEEVVKYSEEAVKCAKEAVDAA